MDNAANKDIAGLYAKKYVAAVIETTGDDPSKDGIIMLSAVRVANGKVVGKFKSLTNPQMQIDEKTGSRAGISSEALVAAPRNESVLSSFLCFIEGDTIVGVDIEKKTAFLNAAAERLGGWQIKSELVDIKKLSESLFPEEEDNSFEAVASAMLGGRKSDYRGSDTVPETLAKCYEALKNYCDDNGILLEKNSDAPAKSEAAQLVRNIRAAEAEQVKSEAKTENRVEELIDDERAHKHEDKKLPDDKSFGAVILEILPMLLSGLATFLLLTLIKNKPVALATAFALIVLGGFIVCKLKKNK